MAIIFLSNLHNFWAGSDVKNTLALLKIIFEPLTSAENSLFQVQNLLSHLQSPSWTASKQPAQNLPNFVDYFGNLHLFGFPNAFLRVWGSLSNPCYHGPQSLGLRRKASCGLSEDALRWDEFTRHANGGFTPAKAGAGMTTFFRHGFTQIYTDI